MSTDPSRKRRFACGFKSRDHTLLWNAISELRERLIRVETRARLTSWILSTVIVPLLILILAKLLV